MVKRGPHLRPQASEGEPQLVGKVRFAGPLSFWHPPRWRCRSFGPDCLEAWRTSRPRRETRVRGDRNARAFLSYGGTAQKVAVASLMMDRALDAMVRRVKNLDRDHDIPYLAGY